MIAHFHIGVKLASWAVGIVAGTIFTFVQTARDTPLTRETFLIGACIVAIPPTIAGIFNLIQNTLSDRRRERSDRQRELQLGSIDSKVDGILSKAHADEKVATSRADSAEGFRAGSESERNK